MFAGIAAAVGAAASFAGGAIKSARAARTHRQQQAELNKAKADNENYYNRYYNADATQFADNRRMLTEAQETLRRNSQAAEGAAAMNGSSNASAAAAKEANNQAYAQAVGSVAANAQQQKADVRDKYYQNKQGLTSQQMQINEARQQSNESAINDAVNGVNTITQSVISTSGKTNSDFKADNDKTNK